ncbi:MAG TPA: serine/threonine-protein kinase [Gemmataceae bacterium]|jgi:serine/threonine protein kinase|nr:serine/threonine-protein kinase [Gemmataceae bacterium]
MENVFRDEPTAAAAPGASPASTVAAGMHAGKDSAAWPLIPDYEILAELAAGGMGVVYRARQLKLNRTVALKMIRAGIHAGAQERARFRIEAEAVAALSHPHIIQIHDYGEWNDMPYLAMEFADGGSLAQRLERGCLSLTQAAALLETLARAVHFVHENGVIHRDLKPANVLFTEQDVPKLADFGLAKRLDQEQRLTQTRAVLGTASYMAPEQAAGNKRTLGPAADIYALGAILYELLTGQPPFRAETHELTIHLVLSEDALPPRRLRPHVPEELEAICLKCLEKEPGRRFASALALAEDLRRHQNGEPLSIQPFRAFEWHARLARRAGYEILEDRGAGVLGVVYKARHLRLGRIVAIEMTAAQGPLDAERLARREAVAQLHHPNIVEVYDFGEHHGELYVAREYLEGGSLADASAGPLQPAEQTAALVETLARAVHYAHQQGLVHGSLRPASVLRSADGTCKITGFGKAHLLRSQPATARLAGYLAPEQVEEGAAALDPATDVYALGAMLYELLSGRPPILADTIHDALQQVRFGKPESPRHWRPELPRELEAICLKCLEKEPAHRYPSAAALAEDLRRFRTAEVLFIDDLDEPAQQQRWARRAGYEIQELLAQRRDGFTYKAHQLALDHSVVLKRVTALYRFVPPAKERFRWEARLLARLRHPNIVQLYDQGEQNDLSYFAREFVEGKSLAEIAGPSPLQPAASHAPVRREEEGIREAARLVEALARAIHAAHVAGIVHGSLHPGKIHLTPAGMPKITSFRRERLPGQDASDTRPETEVRRLACYLAPEQLEGRRRMLDPTADVYALGAILYTLLTRQPPFSCRTLAETLAQVQAQAPAPPRLLQAAVPAELEVVCLKCLEKRPGQRHGSAEALADQLSAAIR